MSSAETDDYGLPVPGPWEAYFDVHGDPFVVPSEHPYLTRRICDVSKSPEDYGRANAFLLAAAPEMLALLRRVYKRCPWFGHSDTYDDPRRRRIDCHDDQCRNSEHVKYERCGHIYHDITEVIARIDNSGGVHA